MRPYEGFNGPKSIFKLNIIEQREMTDRLCLFFLIVFLGGSLLHGIVLFSLGNLDRISNGYDFREEICGINGLVNQPYLYYLEPSVDLNIAICVSECPTSTGLDICLYDIDHFTVTNFCYV